MKTSTPENGFIVTLNAEQKQLFKIAEKYGWNRQKLLDNAQKEIEKAGLGISKDTLRKRFDRLSERYNTFNAALEKDDDAPVPQYPQDKDDPVEDRKESEITYLRKQLNSVRNENNKLRVRSYVATEVVESLRAEIAEVEYDKFYINVKKPNDGNNHLVLPISDAHYGEVVVGANVHNVNEYNPDISKQRHITDIRRQYSRILVRAMGNATTWSPILPSGRKYLSRKPLAVSIRFIAVSITDKSSLRVASSLNFSMNF